MAVTAMTTNERLYIYGITSIMLAEAGIVAGLVAIAYLIATLASSLVKCMS